MNNNSGSPISQTDGITAERRVACIHRRIWSFFLAVLVLAGFVATIPAQEVSIPDPNLNAAIRTALQKPNGPLTQTDMLGLTNLSAIFQNITNLQGLEAAQNLVSLDLQDNQIASLNFPTNLTRLVSLDLSENRFPQLTLPGLTNLTTLRLEDGSLTNLSMSAGLTKLSTLRLGFNHLTSLTLPADMTNLSLLSAFQNQLTNLTLPPTLNSLTNLDLDGNQLRSLTLPSGLTRLNTLIAGANQLTSFTVPTDMTNLIFLRLNDNLLTNLTLAAGLNHLSLLFLPGNQLRNLTLPAGMTNLSMLVVSGNQLTNLTLPPDLTVLSTLVLDGNPLATLVLSEPLAATGLASVVDALQNQGVSVFTYPLTAQLVKPLPLIGAFKFGITGPPGVYAILGSTNLSTWSAVGVATNPLGSVNFHDVITNAPLRKFYRAVLQAPPTNMVFIPANTFIMGSPANELHRDVNEGPQTTVTLTRGFWIGKYEVTQGEYLSVTETNPSYFPGDFSRPVSSVSWPDATNYCWMLTQRELAAGHISPGSHYRLPTEAEWECAARAGTSTRFSYGDDPDYASLTNHAWYYLNGGLTVHPVGQKLPNPWGLYDLEGNVWEWCQDWLGDLPGGTVTDPQGPASNPIGWKVIRGGSYDFAEPDCRSARRYFYPNHPALNDTDLGFRVVLVTEP
ncbi:MAG TPA: SUMF1/EgtB/PvdO family nonheme iron enzyme [Verrucomicrobiae bacterium]|nr:SUMF1/EgtB/PvdO family nonheme iron enzyme [Verrucomicrobiae bacterium]